MSYARDTRERIFAFLVDYIDEHQIAPTFDEIGAKVGIASKSTTMMHLDRLEAQGRIVRRRGSPRSIRVVREPSEDETVFVRAMEHASNVEVLQGFLQDGRDRAWETMCDRDWRGLAVALDTVITQALDNETGWTVNQ